MLSRTCACLSLLLSAACAEPVSGGARSAGSPPAGHLDIVGDPGSDGEERVLTVVSGSDGRLRLGVADRPSSLGAPDGGGGRLDVEVRAGVPARVTVRERTWTGERVLERLVEPLGGEAARDAVLAATPGFPERGLSELDISVEQTDDRGGRRRSSAVFPMAVPEGARLFLCSSERFHPALRRAAGGPLVLSYWLYQQGPVSSLAVVERDGQLALKRDGKDLSLRDHDAPVWVLWLELSPEAR